MGIGTLRRHYNTRHMTAAPPVDPAAQLAAELEGMPTTDGDVQLPIPDPKPLDEPPSKANRRNGR